MAKLRLCEHRGPGTDRHHRLLGLPTECHARGEATGTTGVHNVYISNIDYATGVPVPGLAFPLLQVLGSDQHHGAFLSYSLTNPSAPAFAGQSPGNEESYYTHDVTSMVVEDDRRPPAANSTDPCEVLFDFSESTFDLWDLSNQASPQLLSSNTYDKVR